MIHEQPTLTLKELAQVCSQLVKSKAHYKEMAFYYQRLFSQHANCDPESKLPDSPIAEFYNELAAWYVSQTFAIERRIMTLDGIAEHTFLPGLDY